MAEGRETYSEETEDTLEDDNGTWAYRFEPYETDSEGENSGDSNNDPQEARRDQPQVQHGEFIVEGRLPHDIGRLQNTEW